jgi:hypothetical protein
MGADRYRHDWSDWLGNGRSGGRRSARAHVVLSALAVYHLAGAVRSWLIAIDSASDEKGFRSTGRF